jgi:hypothetical protein
MMLDANESALRTYMRQQDDDAKRASMIELLTVDLMARSEFAFDTGDAIVEAIAECNNAQYQAIGRAAREGAQQLGNVVLAISFAYWHKMAMDKATDEINSEWDSCKCHGTGCKHCKEDGE